MSRVAFEVTTRSGPAGSTVPAVVQADGTGPARQVASSRLARVVGELIDAAAHAADSGMVTEVAVLVYPADLGSSHEQNSP